MTKQQKRMTETKEERKERLAKRKYHYAVNPLYHAKLNTSKYMPAGPNCNVKGS